MPELAVHLILAAVIVLTVAILAVYTIRRKPKAYKVIAEALEQLADTYGPDILKSPKTKLPGDRRRSPNGGDAK